MLGQDGYVSLFPTQRRWAYMHCRANTIPDNILDHAIESYFVENYSRVVIYITSPSSLDSTEMRDNHLYEMDDPYPSALHTDLKRDLHEIRKRQSDNSTNMQAGLGLFEKYQFFTPGKELAQRGQSRFWPADCSI